MAKTTILALVGAFLLFYVVSSPDHAAHITNGAGHLLSSAAHGVGNFVDKLGS